MAKGVELVPSMGPPDFSSILESDASLAVKRQKVLTELGLRKPKRKYASAEERKTAAKKRAKTRRKERTSALKKYGLEPQKKVKKTKAQKGAARKARGKVKREFLREMARQNPELAKKHGIDPSRFRL